MVPDIQPGLGRTLQVVARNAWQVELPVRVPRAEGGLGVLAPVGVAG
jgi:hypothetical protein